MLVFRVKPSFHEELCRIDRPRKYYSNREQKLKDTKPKLPSLCWGFGHTPKLKDKTYSILALGWGPLIQLLALTDAN